MFLKNISYIEDIAFSYDIILNSPNILALDNKLYYYRKQRKNQLTQSINKKIFDIFTIFLYLDRKKMNSNLKQKLLKQKIFFITIGFKYINYKHKVSFLFLSSYCLFNFHKSTAIYKTIFTKKYKKFINYFLAPSFFFFLNICYLWKKLPFIKLKDYN